MGEEGRQGEHSPERLGSTHMYERLEAGRLWSQPGLFNGP